MSNTNHSYKVGEYAYLLTEGEIVKIIGTHREAGIFWDSYKARVVKLSDIDPVDGKELFLFDYPFRALSPIKNQDIQLLLKMSFNTETFNLIRRL